jgi:hypothetical protein
MKKPLYTRATRARRATRQGATGGKETAMIREEWDFRKVPPEELQACFYYEYARASDPITQTVTRWREQIGDLEKAHNAARTVNNTNPRGVAFCNALKELVPLIGELYYLEAASYLLAHSCFPKRPWQLLDKADRDGWEKALRFGLVIEDEKGGIRRILLSERDLEWFYRASFVSGFAKPSRTYDAFEIDWGGGVEKVIRGFEQWARRRWTRLERKKKPRSTYPESLKQLGTMRLYAEFENWVDVQNCLEQYGIKFSDVNACCKAGSKASKREVFPVKWVESGDMKARQQAKEMRPFGFGRHLIAGTESDSADM